VAVGAVRDCLLAKVDKLEDISEDLDEVSTVDVGEGSLHEVTEGLDISNASAEITESGDVEVWGEVGILDH